MNLYLVRHGETEWNRLKKFQGQLNSDLTDIGIEQAKALGKYLEKENIDFDFVYSSPQERAYNTAKLIKEDFQIITDSRLMEMAFGKWEGMYVELIKEESAENFHNFFNSSDKYDHRPHEAESFESLESRIRLFLDEIKEKYKGKNVLVVSHGVTLKVFVKIIKNQNLKEFSESGGIFNTSLSLISYDKKWDIKYLSKLDHLEGELITEWLKK